MRILVTGSHGVIGQSLVPRLEAAGHEVYCYDLKANPLDNIRNHTRLFTTFQGFVPDVCIHMAASVGRINAEEHPVESCESNVIGTLNVARVCAANGVKLVNFSTSEVYGHNSVFGEPDILEQNGIYGLTKLAAEGIVKHYCDTQGLRACSIRPFMVYGPHEPPNGIYRSAVSNFIAAALDGGTIHAHEGCVRSWCYIDDFIDGLLLVIDNHDFDGYAAFSIGTEEYRSMEDCARIVTDIVGDGEYVVDPVPEFYVSAVKKADFAHIQSLGFEPKVMLEEGIRRTVEWQVNR